MSAVYYIICIIGTGVSDQTFEYKFYDHNLNEIIN